MEARILMGVIGKPHGVRGLLRVHSYTAEPAQLSQYAPLWDDRDRTWSLDWRGDGVAQVFDAHGRAVTDRAEAEKLVNTPLFVERGRLPAPDENEFYLADLVGLAAVDQAGAALGRVVVVHDYGAGISLEIERDAGGPLLVPFTLGAVPGVDIAAGRLTVVAPREVVLQELGA